MWIPLKVKDYNEMTNSDNDVVDDDDEHRCLGLQ
jgi:hypothetical protein